MAGIIGIRAEDMEQVDALQRARADWPKGLPLIRPSVRAPVLVRKDGQTVHVPARFGFTRRFASFNAREDRLATSPFWRRFFGTSHGIAALSYVVEWVTDKAHGRRPFLIQRADGKLILAPALVGPHQDAKDEMGFAICTTTPNKFFARFHDRMIGQCTPELMERWLEPGGVDLDDLRKCIHRPPDDELVAVPATPELSKRKAGDWSPIQAIGEPLTWADLRKAPPR